jgi:hypothetical protein
VQQFWRNFAKWRKKIQSGEILVFFEFFKSPKITRVYPKLQRGAKNIEKC